MFGDALKADEAAIAHGAPAHLVSNLPYNVGTPLLIKWLTGPWTPKSLTLMFQREVADRITEGPGEEAYGRLGVIVQAACRAQRVMDAPARAFTPPPKVDSAVVRLEPLPDRPSPERLDALQRITAAAFGQRRKMLRSSLKVLGGEELIAAAVSTPRPAPRWSPSPASWPSPTPGSLAVDRRGRRTRQSSRGSLWPGGVQGGGSLAGKDSSPASSTSSWSGSGSRGSLMGQF